MKAMILFVIATFGLSLFSPMATNGQIANEGCKSSISVDVIVMPNQNKNLTTYRSGFSVLIQELHKRKTTDDKGICTFSSIPSTEGVTYNIFASKIENGICWAGEQRNVKIKPCSGTIREYIYDIKIYVKPSLTGC